MQEWKKIVLFGSHGRLGMDLYQTLSPLGEVVACNRADVDLRDFSALQKFLDRVKPDLIVNAAGYANVDQAEKEQEIVIDVNATAPGVMGEFCRKAGIPLIHYSTDYVFDGTAAAPYTEDQQTNPINFYGKSKLLGEQAIVASGCHHVILRISWLYSRHGSSFLTRILEWAKEKETLEVADDQIGTPTWTLPIAQATAAIVQKEEHRSGIYHLASQGQASRYAFAAETFRHRPGPRLVPVSAAQFVTPAARPLYTPLSSKKIEEVYGIRLPSWQDMLTLYME